MSAKRTSSSLLIDEAPLTVSPSLAAKVGINAAIVLQQINYWLKIAEKANDARKFKNGRWWTYNTYAKWQEQFPWMSESGIRKTIKILKDNNLIATVKYGTQGKDHTLWYTINYDGVEALASTDSKTNAFEETGGQGEGHVSQSDVSTSGSMCPDGTGHVSQSDESYATETSAESSVGEFANAHSPSGKPQSANSENQLRNEDGEERKSQENIVPVEKYVTDRIFERAKAAGYRQPNESYPYHLGRAKDMLAKDQPTDEEIEALPAAFVRLFELKGRADACSALIELRRQRGRERVISESEKPRAEPTHPQSDEARTAKEKPRRAAWYSAFKGGSEGEWQRRIDAGATHSELMEAEHAA